MVDLFAGPGGLAEGFASVRDTNGNPVFQIALSVEKEKLAHRTLRFRAFLRQFEGSFPDEYYAFLNGSIEEPDWALKYSKQWERAEKEALLLELGEDGVSDILAPYLQTIRERAGDRTIVIGGPPCQAYSVVGRSRNRAKAEYLPEKDKRHFLYREYISILKHLKPAAFVMENVKGMFSSTVGGKAVFDMVLSDLEAIGGDDRTYDFFAFGAGPGGAAYLTPTRRPKDFLIRCETFGVPQARHRIIIIGLRRDLVHLDGLQSQIPTGSGGMKVTVRDILQGMPFIRSGVSKSDSPDAWRNAMSRSIEKVMDATRDSEDQNHQKVYRHSEVLAGRMAEAISTAPRSSSGMGHIADDCPPELREWILDSRMTCLSGHASRGHMESDLGRYFFASVYASVCGRSPVAREFPPSLAPKHKNWESGIFSDRFRVQVWGSPSTTITSHIAKDGHYFIHPDPMQCRALTVREAARLQTFPDNYRFFGNQTEQFTQVGNAVPPFLARQIGQALHPVLSAGFSGALSGDALKKFKRDAA